MILNLKIRLKSLLLLCPLGYEQMNMDLLSYDLFVTSFMGMRQELAFRGTTPNQGYALNKVFLGDKENNERYGHRHG